MLPLTNVNNQSRFCHFIIFLLYLHNLSNQTDMKNKNNKLSWLVILALAAIVTACGKDDDPVIPPTPQPQPQPSEGTVGELTYTAPVIGGGNGTGTASDPAVVHYGETLGVEVSQKTSYTDPNGEVFSCEPKAVIKLSVAKDTLYAKDLQALFDHNESKSNPTTSTANEKKTVQQLQTFNVGGNEITFDHAYDIYTHVNSLGKSVELPYLKDGLAKIGKPEADESEAAAAPARVVGIRVSPLAPSTRAGSITDTTAYEVSVSFTVDLTSVNAKAPTTQSLYFKVDYIGIVESTTEIPDPKLEFSYKLDSKSGTTSAASPFEFVPGKTLSLEWQEEITYSYFSIPERSMIELRYEPKAHVEVNAESVDTIWVSNISELSQLTSLDPVVETSDTNPVENTGSYAWNIAGQKVTLDYAYQSYLPIEVEGDGVVLPYLMLKAPEITHVDVAEVPNGVLVGKKGTLYTVTATINQELTTSDFTEPKTEQLQYVVKYLAAIEEQPVTLVDIQYSKGLPQWYEAHNNIGLRYDYGLYRDSIFSDGSVRRIETRSGNAEPECKMFNSSSKGDYIQQVEDVRGVTVYYFPFKTDKSGVSDHNWKQSRKIAVPDISLVTIEEVKRNDQDPREWTRYHGFDPTNPQPGWYWKSFECRNFAYLCYNFENGGGALAEFTNIFAWYNNICYVYDDVNGGQLIDFLGDENDIDDISYAPQVEFTITEEAITMPTGEPAKVFTNACKAKFLGWDEPFPAVLVDTVYQYDPAHPPF